MAVLNIHWETVNRVSPETGPVSASGGAATQPDAAQPAADRPLLVWITHPVDEEENEKIAKVVLDPDKIRVGCAFFRCVKVNGDEAARDPVLAEAGKGFPRMVLLSPSYEVEQVVDGKVSSSKLFSAMKKAASGAYKANFEKNVKAVIKLLGELDKLDDGRKVLDEKAAKGELSPAEEKKIAKEREELDEQQKKALAERDALLKPERKSA